MVIRTTECFGKKLPATGLYVRHAKNVSLNNFQVNLLSPDARPVIWVEDAKEITLRGVKADMPSGGGKTNRRKTIGTKNTGLKKNDMK